MYPLKPILLFAFANDEGRALRLNEEERAIRDILAAPHDQGRIEMVTLGHASLEGVYKSFNRFHNRIAIFHYGGHSDGQFLNLEDTNARASALSQLIGQQKELQLVFLNGCANRQQVETLFANNVRVVIATSAPVDDRRALTFSQQFYDALVHGKTIREAFDTAKSNIENDSPDLNISYTRAAEFVGVPSQDFPWGLYANEEAALDWVLPQARQANLNADYIQEVTLDNSDVNKHLVLETFAGMAEHNEGFASLFKVYEQAPNSALFNALQNTILDAFPSMISIQVRDLFTPEGRSQGRVRLRELNEAYGTLARLLCAIAMANLWDLAADEKTKCDIREDYQVDIERFLRWSPLSGTPTDYFWLVRTISAIFKENGLTPYVNELLNIDNQLEEAGSVYDAYRFLEQHLRQRLIANNISVEEVAPLCEMAEQHLAVLMRASAFLSEYQLVAIKRIAVDLPRRQPEPAFVHQKAILKGRDYATIDTDPLTRDVTSSNNCVFITRDIEKDGLPLNLSPFLIDQNAFKVKKQYLPKIYFLAGYGEEGLHFSHADTTDLDFVVEKSSKDPIYRNLDRLFTGIDHFKQDIGLVV